MPLSLADVETTLRRGRREPLWIPGPDTRDLEIAGPDLERILRHRKPALSLGAVTAIDLVQQAIAGRAWIDPADPILRGHFPDEPVYPGALQLEMLAQLVACYRPIEEGTGADRGFGTQFRGLFLKPVRPGDELSLLAMRIGTFDGLYSRAVGQILRGSDICALGVIEAIHG